MVTGLGAVRSVRPRLRHHRQIGTFGSCCHEIDGRSPHTLQIIFPVVMCMPRIVASHPERSSACASCIVPTAHSRPAFPGATFLRRTFFQAAISERAAPIANQKRGCTCGYERALVRISPSCVSASEAASVRSFFHLRRRAISFRVIEAMARMFLVPRFLIDSELVFCQRDPLQIQGPLSLRG